MNLTSAEILERVKGTPAEAMVRRQLGLADDAKPAKRPKYGNTRVTVDGITFDSKKEANFYAGLKAKHTAGLVRWYALQPRWRLSDGIEYRGDFLVLNADGTWAAIDVKSPATRKDKVYRLKKKLMKSVFNITIEER